MDTSTVLTLFAVAGALIYQRSLEYRIRWKFKQNSKEKYSVLQQRTTAFNGEELNEAELQSLLEIQQVLQSIWKVDFSWLQPDVEMRWLDFDKWVKRKRISFMKKLQVHWNTELPHLNDVARMKVGQLMKMGAKV